MCCKAVMFGDTQFNLVQAVLDEVCERENDYEKRRDLRKKMTAWRKSLEKARSLPELPCTGLAELMVDVGTCLACGLS